MKRNTLIIDLFIIVFGALFFITGIGGVRLFDWDEINFAESAREMILTGDWFNVQINFESFWEKPPLFIWMQALCMKVFGVGEFAARLPDALMGIITLLTLFHIGLNTEGKRFGLLWAGLYAISFLPFFYFKSGIIDPWFNFFIFLGIYFFARYTDEAAARYRMRHAALSGLFTGLAILTKGPVAFLIFGLTFFVWLIFRRFRLSFRWKDVGAYLLMLALAGGAWFIALAVTGHSEVIKDFIDYQIRLFETKDAGHGGFLLYHFVILLFGVTPASFFAVSTFRPKVLKGEDPDSRSSILFRWMMVSLWVVLILFTIVRTKIVHYSSFCYFPITFLGAWAASRMMDGKLKFTFMHKFALIGTAALYGIVLTGLTLFDKFKLYIIPYVDDPFAVSCMEASSEWKGFEPFVGAIMIAATIWFCISFAKNKKLSSFAPLAAGNLLFAMTAILCAVPEVEKYSQASAVDFYIERQGEDCYVMPAYFKSYAQYFYTDRQPDCSCDDFEWLARGPIDKPCYFVVKDIPEHVQRLEADVPEARLLKRQSGFQFFIREIPDKQEDAAADDEQKSEVE